jgi:nicotinic acid mononucleotide adenylyltransferase
MGADNLRSFHRWQRWRDITKLTPIAVIDRPQSTLKAAHSRAANYLAPWRLDEADGGLLADRGAPGFIFLHGPRSELSSTELRAKGIGALACVIRGLDAYRATTNARVWPDQVRMTPSFQHAP